MSIFHLGSRRVRGFTLTEVAIVLGIVGIILGSIWIAAAAVYRNMRINRTYEQVLILSQNIRALFGGGNTTGLPDSTNIVQMAIKANAFPSDMVSTDAGGNTHVNHVWAIPTDNTVTVYATDMWFPRFWIEFLRTPQDVCIKMLTMLTGDKRDSTLFRVGHAEDWSDAVLVNNTAFPVNLVTATDKCSNSDTPGFYIEFGLK